MTDQSILNTTVATAPSGYTVKGAQEIVIKSVSASFDGTGAAGSFIPAVQIVDPSGFITGTYPCGSALTAGASADVSWFPIGGGSGSAALSGTINVPVYLDTPDSVGNGFVGLSTTYGFSNIRRACPALDHLGGVVSSWTGTVRVPNNYASSPVIVLSMVCANTSANKAARVRVATSVVPAGSTEDAALTAEAYVNITVPTTANQRFDQSYPLSTSPTPGASLNVQVSRDASNVGDTLTANPVLIWEVLFTYLV